jgi:galactose mutarotase-like enzyme
MDRDALICLAAAGDQAELRPAGGELVAWRVADRNLLWTMDPEIWPRTSPILFPIVGRARNGEISIDGRKYPMSIHGFAATSRFVPVSQSQDSVCLRLTDDAVTRASFPFSFQLDVSWRLAPRQLGVAFTVTNTGDVPLPYALGWHPGFAWPFSAGRRDDYAIAFERPEAPEVPVITADGLFSRSRRQIPVVGRDLPLSEGLMAKEALCFLEAHSRSLRFVAPDGAALRVELQDFPHIALWSHPPAPFLCIEAWTGHGDPEGFAGDISEKPSMRLLPAGATAGHGVRLTFEGAGAAG